MTHALAPSTDIIDAVKAIAGQLGPGELRLEGTDQPLPPEVAALVRTLLAAMAAGQGVALVSQDSEMTPNEAAEFLNVSRGYVIKLMDQGQLPFRTVGSHRRISGVVLAAYRARQDEVSRRAMDELVRISEELGLYDDPGPPPPKSAFRAKGQAE